MGIGAAIVGLGSTILGSLGASATFLATGLGATLSGVVGGALVGAAVGGLTSAVMGGDIGQGILFGAVGGAVTGGISGYLGSAGVGLSNMQGTGMVPVAEQGGQFGAEGLVFGAEKAIGSSTVGGSLQAFGSNLVKEFGGDAIKGIAGAYMKGKEMDAAQENWLEQAKVTQANKLEQMREEAKLVSEYGSGGSGAIDYSEIRKYEADLQAQTTRENLAEQRRQFNVGADERQQARADIQKKEADRQALFTQYKSPRGTASVEDTSGEGVMEARQKQALAATEGGQPLTKEEEALA